MPPLLRRLGSSLHLRHLTYPRHKTCPIRLIMVFLILGHMLTVLPLIATPIAVIRNEVVVASLGVLLRLDVHAGKGLRTPE